MASESLFDMARSSVQQVVPVMPVNRVDRRAESRAGEVNDVDPRLEIPLEMAKAHVAAAVKRTVRVTGRPYKAFGDRSFVHAWTTGEKNPNVAALCQYRDSRREFALALLEDDPDVEVEEHLIVKVRKSKARA